MGIPFLKIVLKLPWTYKKLNAKDNQIVKVGSDKSCNFYIIIDYY